MFFCNPFDRLHLRVSSSISQHSLINSFISDTLMYRFVSVLKYLAGYMGDCKCSVIENLGMSASIILYQCVINVRVPLTI